MLEKTFPGYNYVSLDLPNLAREARENGGYFLEKYKAPVIINEIQYASELFTNQIAEWMIQGGYPEIHAHNLRAERFYADYLATYLERDVRQLVNVKDLSIFNKLLRLLSLRSGQVLSMNSLASDVGASSVTIKKWISVLEASNIIYLLKPFYKNYGKRLIKSPKLYFLDTGLLCFLAGIHNSYSLLSSSLLGSFFETLALGQLIRNFCHKGLAVNLYYFRDNHGNEIDFIIPEGTQVELYECKWKLQSGFPPKNIAKIKSVIGAENVKRSKIISRSNSFEQIEKNCFVTNLIDL